MTAQKPNLEKVTHCAPIGLLSLPFTAGASARDQQKSKSDLVGNWLTVDGKAIVRIEACGQEFCGHIVFLREPNDEKGQPLKEINYQQPQARAQLVCGLQILDGLKQISGTEWSHGQICHPEEGRTCSAAIVKSAPDRLQVFGYIGARSTGQTLVWHRAPNAFKHCAARETLGRP